MRPELESKLSERQLRERFEGIFNVISLIASRQGFFESLSDDEQIAFFQASKDLRTLITDVARMNEVMKERMDGVDEDHLLSHWVMLLARDSNGVLAIDKKVLEDLECSRFEIFDWKADPEGREFKIVAETADCDPMELANKMRLSLERWLGPESFPGHPSHKKRRTRKKKEPKED